MMPVRVTEISNTTIRLGTRGSELALRQAELVEAALAAALPGLRVERKVIHTTGDLKQDMRLGQPLADKGVFTKELEVALACGDIDLAVHSLKDVPTEIDPLFRIAATLPRARVEEVLFTKSGQPVAGLPKGATVATSSARRARQLLWINPGLHITEIRGNVPTRIRKFLENPACEGLMLARAGLDRLGFQFEGERMHFEGRWLSAHTLGADHFLPAVSQGAIGLEIRSADPHAAAAVAAINHAPTYQSVSAEREFLRLLKAGCHTPVGLLSSIEGGILSLSAIVFDEQDHTRRPQHGLASGPVEAPLDIAAELLANLR
jgi:hydroxymethylbilane synthase